MFHCDLKSRFEYISFLVLLILLQVEIVQGYAQYIIQNVVYEYSVMEMHHHHRLNYQAVAINIEIWGES